jgi:cellulose synthase operon protein C
MRYFPFARGLTALLFALLAAMGCDTLTAEEHVSRAEARIEAGNYNAAVIELKNSLQKSPDLVSARQLLGELHILLGQYHEGLTELERAYDQGADRNSVLPGILHAKVRLGRHQEVLGELHDATGLDATMEVTYGDALLAAGDSAAAAAAYRRALEQQPGHVGALLGQGRLAWQAGDLAETRARFEQITASPDLTMDAMLTFAEFELSQGNPAAARELFERAVQLPGLDVAAWIGVARTHVAEQDLDAAMRVIDSVLETNPTMPAANYLLGLVNYQQQEYDEAETALRRVLQHAPDHPQTTLLLGIIKVHQRQFSQAQDLLQRYLNVDRTSLTARKMLAGIHLEEGRPERAADVLRSQPEDMMDGQAWSLLGAANLRAGNLEQATAAFQAAVDAAPDAPASPADATAVLGAEPRIDGGRAENQVMLIVSLLRDGKYEQALEAGTRLVDEQPDNPLGYNFLGAAHIGLDDIDSAEQAFLRALEIDPTYHPAATNLAQLALRRGDPDAATARYRALLKNDPGNLPALMGLAQMALRDNDRAEAERYLTSAAEHNPDAVQPRLLKAQLAYAAGDRERARGHADEVLNLDSDNLLGLLMRARLELDANDTQRAGTTLDRLQRRVGNLPTVQPDVLFRLAQMQLQLGRTDTARVNLNQVVSAQASHVDALTVLAQLEISDSNWTPARRLIEQVKAAAPDRPLHLVLEGDLHRTRGETERALEHYEQAAAEGSRDAVFRLVAMHQSAGDVEAVIATLEPRARANPDDSALVFTLAGGLLSANRLDEAREHYERLRERLPQNAVVLNNLAWIYFQQGDDRARELAERAHELAPQNAAIMDTLGIILLRDDEVDRARDLLRQAAEASGDNPTIRYHLATAHRRAGDTAEARDLLRDVLGSDADFPERDSARALLAELE